jgi:hypothetical protein
MQRWQRWVWWLTPPYGAEIRRQQIIDEARRWQDEERAAAVRARLAGVAEILDEPAAQS